MSVVATNPILREVEYLREVGLAEADIATATAAGRSTVRSWLAGKRLPTGERRARLVELAAMVERLERVMGRDYIPIWMIKPVPLLEDQKPVEVIGQGRYLDVARVISGMESQIAV
ncbi:MAG: hypothetical protein M9938_10925 [Solirubrobacterales bacterium]|nr:hypothetical protein [Solirubrobacterales bacterium]